MAFGDSPHDYSQTYGQGAGYGDGGRQPPRRYVPGAPVVVGPGQSISVPPNKGGYYGPGQGGRFGERNTVAVGPEGRTGMLPGRAGLDGKYNTLYDQSQARPESSFRGDQNILKGVLTDRSQGKNLLSTELLRQGADRNIKQQMAMAASARPGQVGMAMRGAAQNVGAINSGLAGQQTIAGIQEQMQNQALLNNLLQTGRGQDLQSQGLRDSLAMGATNAQAGMSQAELNAQTQRYGIDTNARTSLALGKMQQPKDWERAAGAAVPILGIGATLATGGPGDNRTSGADYAGLGGPGTGAGSGDASVINGVLGPPTGTDPVGYKRSGINPYTGRPY